MFFLGLGLGFKLITVVCSVITPSFSLGSVAQEHVTSGNSSPLAGAIASTNAVLTVNLKTNSYIWCISDSRGTAVKILDIVRRFSRMGRC